MNFRVAAPVVLALAICALYLPFLSNPLVFDDRGLFSGSYFAEYATKPFGYAPRFPAMFSIASVHVLFGNVEAHRLVSLVLHVAAAWALFVFIRAMQRASRQDAPAAAFVAAALFALHPVTVYGAAYLAQRSGVLATLFSLMAATAFVHGLAIARYRYAFLGATLYSIAVLSKEHAILVPGVIAIAALGLAPQRKFGLLYTGAFLAVCAPASQFVLEFIIWERQLVGSSYEPQFVDVAAQVAASQAPAAQAAISPWLGSALAQATLFFRHIGLWLWPDTARMSFDLRVDFAAMWSPRVAIPALAAYVALGGLGLFLVSRGGRRMQMGLGILWFWVLYLIEFSAVRFQEPFALYRAYLWAPGIAIIVAAILQSVPLRPMLAGGVAVAIVVSLQAHDRLRTFSSGLALWKDAVAKLPAQPVAGGSRPLYQLGREYLNAGEPDKALAVIDRCFAQYPATFQCVFARAAILMTLERYEEALPYLVKAIELHPNDGVPRHHLGLAFEYLGCRDEAAAHYERSAKLGFGGGRERLKSLRNPGDGLLPPVRPKERAKPFACSEASQKLGVAAR